MRKQDAGRRAGSAGDFGTEWKSRTELKRDVLVYDATGRDGMSSSCTAWSVHPLLRAMDGCLSAFRTRMCGQTLLFIVIAKGGNNSSLAFTHDRTLNRSFFRLCMFLYGTRIG